MTLPYPRGLETGKLKSVEPGRSDPLDIERRVNELVVPAEPHVDVAGRQLRVAPGASVDSEVARFRARLTERLLERRPHADEATFRKLHDGLRGAFSRHQELDEAAVQQALELVDGL